MYMHIIILCILYIIRGIDSINEDIRVDIIMCMHVDTSVCMGAHVHVGLCNSMRYSRL